MDKLDLSKKYKTYFTAKTKPEIVEIEPAQFLSLTGKATRQTKPILTKYKHYLQLHTPLNLFLNR